ncbi:MAG: MCE family protein [Bryobacterales bacterium]|nr:MCE family protein [Bryobacterales bacterium]
MANKSKTRWAQLRVGIMAIVALVILGTLIFLLTSGGSLFRNTVPLYTYMGDSGAMAQRSPVRLNGIVIGSVKSVSLSGDKTPGRAIRIELEVYEDMLKNIPVDSTAFISAENLLGTKFINITMGDSAETVKSGGEVKARQVEGFDEVVASSYDLLTSLKGILDRMDAIIAQVEKGEGSIGKFIVDPKFYDELTRTVVEVRQIAQAVGDGKGTVGKLLYDTEMYDRINKVVGNLDGVVLDLRAGKGTAGKLLTDDALYAETRASIAELKLLLTDLNQGKGTMGKLLKDDQIAKDLGLTLNKVNTTIDNINDGKGTIGQLMVNPQLYESLNGFSVELKDFMKDVRANPKKYLRVKLSIF